MKREEFEELEELEGPAEREEVAERAEVEERTKKLFCANRVAAHGGIHFHSNECRDGEPLISLNNITKNYGARDAEGSAVVLALKGVNLQICRGEYVAVMGSSGSGKSTLMNILGSLDLPSGGSYLFNGKDLKDFSERELARLRNREIGFVFQSFNLLAGSNALDNVALPLVYAGVPLKERRERALEALREVGLEGRAYHRPAQMSGGERQRVAIARALINKPLLILADEPTGNLDTANSIEIMRLFEKIHLSGRTLIVVTHEEEIAAFAERIIRVRDGIIVEDKILAK